MQPEPFCGSGRWNVPGRVTAQSAGFYTQVSLRTVVLGEKHAIYRPCSRSHAPRGNAVKGALRRELRIRDAARPALHSHVARGNEELTVFRRHLCITTSAEHGHPKRTLLLMES